MTKSNIVLIGMPGAGKSTLGVLLAKALGKDYVDTDLLIQRREKRLLQEIIDSDGIDAFMRLEEDVLRGLRARNSVIATGGSAVYSERAMAALRRDGTAVYLHLPIEEIERRITNITTRGIVLRKGCGLPDAYAERLPLYRKYADVTVDCTGRDTEGSLAELLDKLRESRAG